jgi:hypothetical protein
MEILKMFIDAGRLHLAPAQRAFQTNANIDERDEGVYKPHPDSNPKWMFHADFPAI